MNLEEIGPRARRVPLAPLAQIVKVRVVDPLAIERDHRVRHGSVAAFDKELLRAVGTQEHQVRSRLHRHGLGEVGVVPLVNLVAGASGAHVDDVVIPLRGRIRRDVRNADVELLGESQLTLAEQHGREHDNDEE